jgi:hypothetical protein
LSSGEQKCDHLIGVSGRPHGLVHWLIPASAAGTLMDEEAINIQHAMSDTKWFFPSRTDSDVFSTFRYDYEDFVTALRTLT